MRASLSQAIATIPVDGPGLTRQTRCATRWAGWRTSTGHVARLRVLRFLAHLRPRTPDHAADGVRCGQPDKQPRCVLSRTVCERIPPPRMAHGIDASLGGSWLCRPGARICRPPLCGRAHARGLETLRRGFDRRPQDAFPGAGAVNHLRDRHCLSWLQCCRRPRQPAGRIASPK